MSNHPVRRRTTSRRITKCANGKYRIGSGACTFSTRAAAKRAKDRR